MGIMGPLVVDLLAGLRETETPKPEKGSEILNRGTASQSQETEGHGRGIEDQDQNIERHAQGIGDQDRGTGGRGQETGSQGPRTAGQGPKTENQDTGQDPGPRKASRRAKMMTTVRN